MRRLLPPILVLILLAAIAALSAWHPPAQPIRAGAQLPWDVPLALGLLLLILGRLEFRRARAEIHTFRAPRGLVNTGVFRWTRNPMYLGMALLLLAAAAGANLWCALLAPLAFLLAAALWYIPHEERAMRAAFGAEYDAYAGAVRRWI